MTLDDYLKQHGITETAFADMIGVDQSTVNRMRRNPPQTPNRELMHKIFAASNGAVRADDFFGLQVMTPQSDQNQSGSIEKAGGDFTPDGGEGVSAPPPQAVPLPVPGRNDERKAA